MSVWSMPSVASQPNALLMQWRVYRFVLGDQHWDILSGWDVENACGRCSTPVSGFEPSTATVRTRSGRVYKLEAEPGNDDDARYVFESRYGRAVPEGLHLIDATDEYWTRITGRTRRPLLVQRSRALHLISLKADIVFGDADEAARWLGSHCPALAAKPASLIGSRAGRRIVHDELSRIASGGSS